MKQLITIAILSFILTGCGSKKHQKSTTKSPTVTVKNQSPSVTVAGSPKSSKIVTVTSSSSSKINDVVSSAMHYLGTKYKYGGTTKKGMDCSGLVYTSLLENNIDFRRSSYEMSQEGEEIKLKKVQIGDLLFFTTGKSRRVNHVGMVVALEGDDVKFIHSTTSRGVIISSIKEGYWSNAYNSARRIKY